MNKLSPKLRKILTLGFAGVLTFGLATGVAYHDGLIYHDSNVSYVSNASHHHKLTSKQIVKDVKNGKHPVFYFKYNGKERPVKYQNNLTYINSVREAETYAKSLGRDTTQSDINQYKSQINAGKYKNKRATLIHMIEDSGYNHVINILNEQIHGKHVDNSGKLNYSVKQAKTEMKKYNKVYGTNLTWPAVVRHYVPKYNYDCIVNEYPDTFPTYIHDAIQGDPKNLTYDGSTAYDWGHKTSIRRIKKNLQSQHKGHINWSKIKIPKEPDNIFEPYNYWFYYHARDFINSNGLCGNTTVANEGLVKHLPMISNNLDTLQKNNRLNINWHNSHKAISKYGQPKVKVTGKQTLEGKPVVNDSWKSLSTDNSVQKVGKRRNSMHPSVGGPDAPRVLGTREDHDPLGLGTGHEFSDYHVLQKDAGNKDDIYIRLPEGQPPKSTIDVSFPGQAEIKTDNGKELLTPHMVISDIQYYHPWYGTYSHGGAPRSLNISKNLYEGMKFNGIISMRVNYKFYKEGTTTPVTNLEGSYLNIRHLDGLSQYLHDTKNLEYEADNNEQYVRYLWNKRAFNKNGDVAHHSPSYWIGATPHKHLVAGDRRDSNFFTAAKNSFEYLLPNDKYFGYRAIRCSKNYNLSDPTGNSIQYDSSSSTDANDGEYSMDKNSVIGTYHSDIYSHLNNHSNTATGGLYATAPTNDYQISVIFKLGKSQESSTPNNPSGINDQNGSVPPDFIVGSGTGYGNMRPMTQIKPTKTEYICKKYTYKEPTGTKSNPSSSTLIKYINIVINRDRQNSKAIPLSDFVGKNAKQHVNQTMFKHTTVDGQTNGDGGNYKKATILVGSKNNQHREFKNDKQAVKWASNINCLVVKPPKPQPCKQGSKQCPTQKFQKTVMKKGPDGSIHVPDHEIEDYDNGDYYNGGILKHPNQKYDYKIHGQLPLLDKQAYYYKSSTDSKGHTTYSSIPTYYDDSRDNFVLNDTIPSEVKMLSVPQMKVNGQSISATSGMSHNMQFKFNESQLAGLQSGGTPPVYDVYIPVEAAPKSGSNKDFDSSQKGYGLPDVTGSNYKHWLSFLNKSNFSSDIHVGYNGSTNEPDNKMSNALVNIKEIKATIYNYNYNKNYYPNSEQPYGFNFNKSCNKTSTDPTSRYYKDYRYHSKEAKAHKIGDPLYYYGYVNSDFAVRSLEKDQGKHTGQHGTEEWRYRLVYPSLPVKGYLPAINSSENNNSVWNINSKRYQAAKDSISDDWSKKDPNYWADNDNANNALPMVFNPNDTKNHCGNDAYTSSGFSQTNYIPYIVPHISFIPKIQAEKKLNPTERLDRDGQLIVDTDSAKHGLPFRFNMRAQNVLYGYHFWNDFKDDNGNPDMVTMHVIAGKGKHAPELYKATRRLVGNKSNSLARFNGYKHQHYVTKDEWPKGNHNWTGYDEADAFKAKNSSQYDLDISKLHLSKGEKIPLHVYFTSTGLARISYRNLDSHAYNAAKPKVMRKTNKSFGYTHNVSDGSDSVKGNNNPNKSTYIEPERTVKYFGESPNDPDKQVRELKEELNVTQPHYAYGKTGYGMTANDLGISYAGHLEEPRYVHKGTNMTYAFPSPFQKKDTHIKYSKDNRHSEKLNATIYKNDNKSTKTAYKRLADVLLHVEPHSQSHQVTTSNSIDNGMPSNLDDPNGIKYYADADNYYGDFLNKEHLWSGKFATSYGFYPRQATHNVRTSSNGIDSNGGDITIAPHGPSGIESRRYDDKPVSDKTNTNIFGVSHNVNGFNGYGLNGVKTNNGAHHIITNSQGIKDAQMSNEDIKADGQDERMFTPIFMNTGWYSTNFHRSYRQMNRKHRLGGNFFDIDENRPIKFYGHIYIAKNSKSKENDEFSLQPILSNTKNGLSQTPSSAPLFPTNWLSSADGSMAPNWYDAKIFAKKHKHHGHKRWSMNIGTHQKELEKKY